MDSKPSIKYIQPTSQALGRMTTILFRPFDIGKWFVLGFSAWLATIFNGNGGSGGGSGGSGDGSTEGSGEPLEPFSEWLETTKIYFQENMDWIIGVGIGIIVLIMVIFLVLGWINARGKFMLLDNVVYNRALVKAPWREFKSQGNSLFLWKLVFHGITSIVFGGILGGVGVYIYSLMPAEIDFEPVPTFFNQFPSPILATLIGTVIGLFLIMIVIAYFLMLLEDFVIPLMHKRSVSTNDGWRVFFEIHRSHVGNFILYALWKFVLRMAGAIVVMMLVFATCCIAGCLMSIPYLGAVLILPVTLFFRALGPEFLRQFGPSYDLWEGASDHFNFDDQLTD